MSAYEWRLVVYAALALAALIGAWRAGINAPRARWSLAALNVAAAVLLAIALYPPVRDVDDGALVVLTGGIRGTQLAGLSPHADTVALPEAADAPAFAVRVADLASALRLRNGTPRLRIVGDGLLPRDRDALAAHALRFDAAATVRALQTLWYPRTVAAGARFSASGRIVAGVAVRAELRDPSGAVVATSRVLRDGRFTVAAAVRGAGDVRFTLKLRDARDAVIEDVPLPITVSAAKPPRVLFLAGAPSPDLKYLRRWARDAGVDVGARIGVSPGITIDRATPRLDAATLAEIDLVVIDDRAWRSLVAAERSALLDGTRAGLGVLLRLSAEPDDAMLREWAELGLPLQRDEKIARTVTLREELGALPREIALWRLPLRAAIVDGAPLLRADDDVAPGAWIPIGRGRLAALWLTDSYRLVLEGHADRYGTLWSRIVADIARVGDTATPALPDLMWRDERVTLCDLGAQAFVIDPAGEQHALVIDAAADTTSRCAAYWPRASGWHVLREGEARVDFYVRDIAEASALHAAQTRTETRALQRDEPPALAARTWRWMSDASAAASPTARWPWAAAWLVVMVLSWWLERRARR
jgi:hypothetical protein